MRASTGVNSVIEPRRLLRFRGRKSVFDLSVYIRWQVFSITFEMITISEFNTEAAEEHGGARRNPGVFKIGSGCESLLPIFRVLCALCVLCVETCQHWQIRSSENLSISYAVRLCANIASVE